MGANPGVIKSGSVIFDQIVTVLLSTTMFTAGVMGFILDNTVPGGIQIAMKGFRLIAKSQPFVM